jgi:hypothetical protein
MTDYFPTGDKAGTPYSELPSPNPEQYNEIDEADSRLNTLYGRVLVLSSADFARKRRFCWLRRGHLQPRMVRRTVKGHIFQ